MVSEGKKDTASDKDPLTTNRKDSAPEAEKGLKRMMADGDMVSQLDKSMNASKRKAGRVNMLCNTTHNDNDLSLNC